MKALEYIVFRAGFISINCYGGKGLRRVVRLCISANMLCSC